VSVEQLDPVGVDNVPDAPTIECEQCGETFTHGKAGRRPKRCTSCRATSSSTSSSGRGETAPRSRSTEALRRTLQQQLGVLGLALTFVDPYDSTVVLKHAEEGALVLANLAATNPSIRRTLERSAELAGWMPVLLWVSKMTIPIAAHHGLIRGVDDPAAKPPPAAGNGAGPLGAFGTPYGSATL
jgi:hypothetical protein